MKGKARKGSERAEKSQNGEIRNARVKGKVRKERAEKSRNGKIQSAGVREKARKGSGKKKIGRKSLGKSKKRKIQRQGPMAAGEIKMRIIIVEDEKITRQWVKQQIEKLRPEYYIVETFANGRQALDYMESHETDVLFTDIRMPVMDGLELLGELQRRENRAYKVILSAYDEFQYAQQALRLGANEFTLKPEITKEELGRILGEAGIWLEKQSREREIPEDLQEQREIWMRQMLGQSARTDQGPDQTKDGGEQETERSVLGMESAGQKTGWLGEEVRKRGIELDEQNLRAVCISFSKAVPREKVMELLQLYFAEERVKHFCLQLGVQSFGAFFNQKKPGMQEDFGERLWELLRIHVGTEVYIGISGVGSGYDRLGELCGQAVAAKENRQFFELSGCLQYADLRMGFSGEERRTQLGEVCADGRTTSGEAGKKNRGKASRVDGEIISDGYGKENQKWEIAGKEQANGGLGGSQRMYFGDAVQEILDAVEARDFGWARKQTAAFFEEAGTAHDLQPACIIAPGREILTGYMRGLRAYPLSREESVWLHQCELLLGRQAFQFRKFREEILRAVGFLSDALEQKERRRGCSPAVQKILQYVEEHYGERISLDQVAAAAFLSRSYASVLFKKETGEKFSDYLQRIRIEKACTLLKDTSLSIQETADRTGFFDTAHFSRVFKEKMGVSPMEYRKKKREKK